MVTMATHIAILMDVCVCGGGGGGVGGGGSVHTNSIIADTYHILPN